MLSVLMSLLLYEWSLGRFIFPCSEVTSKFKKYTMITAAFFLPYMVMGLLFSIYFENDRSDVMKQNGLFGVEWNEDVQVMLRWAMAALGTMYLIYFMLKVSKIG